MKPHRVRQICGSRNPFTPSIALWQHFVLPCHHLRQARQLFTATETTESLTGAGAQDASPTAPAAPLAPKEVPETQSDEQARPLIAIRRGGASTFIPPRNRSIGRKANKRAKTTEEKAEAARSAAKDALDSSEDYEGMIVEAIAASEQMPPDKLPWAVKRSTHQEPMERLSEEIERFHDYARPNRFEALVRRKLIEQVRTTVREALPNHILEVFGSERTGIALATSDIDFRLLSHEDVALSSAGLPPPPQSRKHLLDQLYKLYRKRLQRNKNYVLPMLRHARYPLISFQDRASGIDCQIVLSNDTSRSREYMQQYMQEYPYLRQVYTVVKTTFDVRGLSDVFRGGFGSYSIFMMLVASLKHHPNPRQDAAGALRNFFFFWGQFETSLEGISIDPPVKFNKSEELVMSEKAKAQLENKEHKPLPSYMLCLRDPADETNDLGRKGACIKHVQKTFKHIAWKLDAQLRTGKTAFAHSFLQTMVGDTYMLNFARRQRLEQEGRALLASMKSSFAYTAQAIRDEEKVKAQDGQNAAEQAMKLRQISERQAAMTDVDAYGGVVTSILGMPSVDEFKDGNVDPYEDEKPPEEVDRSEDVDSSKPPSIHYDVSKTYGSNFHYRVSRKQTPGGTGSLP